MVLHIGKLIEQKAKAKNIGPTALGRLLNTSPQNMYGIYRRRTIDTELLQKISEVLEYNFFSHYINELPSAITASDEIKRRDAEINELKLLTERQNEKITTLMEFSEQQKKIISLLEKKEKSKPS
jgi:hypothetical protein